MDIEERILKIEQEIRKTPYHKGTEHHIGKLRAKLAKLREQLLGGRKRKKGGSFGFAIKKQGDATVVFLGFPSVGKSTLLNKLTNARSKIAPYAFTTVRVIPGMMRYKGAYIQLLDLPGIIEEAALGHGRGREIFSVVRNADLLLLISQIGKEEQFKIIKAELLKIGLVLNQPQADKRLYESRPSLFLINKIDLKKNSKINQGHATKNDIYHLSAKEGSGLEELKEAIWQKLNLKRIYLKRTASALADFEHPLIVKEDFTIKEIAEKISGEFSSKIKSGKIWQGSAKYPAQEASLNYCPEDETIIFLK